MVRPFEGAIKPPITTSGIFRGTVASGRARDSVHNSEPEMAGAARQPGETAVGQGIGAASAAGWSGGYPALGLLPAGRRTRLGGVPPRGGRSEERRVGDECVRTSGCGGAALHGKKK